MFFLNFNMVFLFMLLLAILPLSNAVQSSLSTFLLPVSNFAELSMEMDLNAKTFAMVVSFISAMIYLYSYFYMGTGKDMNTFRSVLMVFVFSMLILILSASFLTYILGWDGLGVSSFLLVIYYSSLLATRSGLATFITNRLGDFFIIASFIFFLALDPMHVEQQLAAITMNYNTFMSMFFFLLLAGAFTKSAQIPFSAWLPAAMAAPTPVSALVHSSTLVTAGLYIISKFLYSLDQSTDSSIFFCLVTISLSAMAGLMATVESDLKKLVAMSTLSQMGLIGYIMFLKEANTAMFHIFSHATFKSLLFVVVGSLIIFNTGFQDIRVKSMSMHLMKVPMMLLILSSFSLTGLMYSSGFFSKDLIILSLAPTGVNFILYTLLLFSCVMTACYTLKSFKLLLNNMNLAPMDVNKGTNKWLSFSTLGLFYFTLSFGYFFFWNMLDQENYTIEYTNKLLGVWILMAGCLISLVSWKKTINMSLTQKNISYKTFKIFFMHMTNLSWISNNFFSSFFKIKNINFYEPTWWAYLSEMVGKKTKMLDKKYSSMSIANSKLALEQTLYFLLFSTNVLIITMFFF